MGSSAAGEVASTMYTLVASVSRHNIDIWAYMNDVLRRLVGGETEMESLLPDLWAASHPDSIRTYREAEQALRVAKTNHCESAAASSPNVNSRH